MTESLILDRYREVQPCLPHFLHSLKDKHWIAPVGLLWAYGNAYRRKSSSEAFSLCSRCLRVIIGSCLTPRLLQLLSNEQYSRLKVAQFNKSQHWPGMEWRCLVQRDTGAAVWLIKHLCLGCWGFQTDETITIRCFSRPFLDEVPSCVSEIS